MYTTHAHSVGYSGTNYEIGYQLGTMVGSIQALMQQLTAGVKGFEKAEVGAARQMFDRWCPGLSEELQGFADSLKVNQEQIIFYAMTCLHPRCSQIALPAERTKSGHPLLARNYEFSHEAEDFTMVRTNVQGKYTHLGTSVLLFGRDDGLNEHGLAVTMSSCGFPVGAMPFMRAPKLKGFQFWAVIRAVLENCKDVTEALEFLKDMPIAYNLNLMLMDKSGNVALVETLDGRMAVKKMDDRTKEGMLWATNHPVLPELIPYEPEAMVHSLQRYKWIEEMLDGKVDITVEEIKNMLLSKYPEGLCCHYFEEFFGTTKSMVIDPVDGTIELCWGGQEENGWQVYKVTEPLEKRVASISLNFEKLNPEICQFVPIK